jgi:ArsR family transcriptional regulator
MKTLPQTAEEARAVAMLRALANPARFRIVQLLAGRTECVTGELVGELPLAQSSVSEHLKVLKDAGIVRGTLDGPERCFCLDPVALAFLRGVLGDLEQRACC